MFDTRRQPPQRPDDLYEGDDPVISELVNQSAPNRDDAGNRRREYAINRGSKPATTAGNPLYPDTADRFNQTQYGTRNAGVTYGTPANKNTDPSNGVVVEYQSRSRTPRPKKTVSRYSPNSELSPANNFAPPIRERETTVPRVRQTKKKKPADATNIALRAVGQAKALAVGFWSSAWAFNTWLLIQMPLAVLSIIGLGIWYYLEYLKAGQNLSLWEKAIGFVANTTEEAFRAAVRVLTGWDVESLTAIFFIAYIALLFFAFLTLFITILGFGATFCRPLSGRMAGLKWSTLLLCVVGYMTPGLNLFPWVLLYIWVVALYPR